VAVLPLSEAVFIAVRPYHITANKKAKVQTGDHPNASSEKNIVAIVSDFCIHLLYSFIRA